MEGLCSDLWAQSLQIQTYDADLLNARKWTVSQIATTALNATFLMLENGKCSPHNLSGIHTDIKLIWFHGETFGWYQVLFKRPLSTKEFYLTFIPVKSEVIWATFWSSLPKN